MTPTRFDCEDCERMRFGITLDERDFRCTNGQRCILRRGEIFPSVAMVSGYCDHKAGKPIGYNPFIPDTDEAEAWERGWNLFSIKKRDTPGHDDPAEISR